MAADPAREGASSGPALLDLARFDFALPPERIAQEPTPERDGARLLVLDRASGARRHATVRDLPALLRPGDLLVVNATRVVPAKLRGAKETGGAAEALLLGPGAAPGSWRALVGCRGRLRPGQRFTFARDGRSLAATLVTVGLAGGEVELAFPEGASPYDVGETPLPPYIQRRAPEAADAERYQAVFARVPGSVAAPTASLHLSEALLAALGTAGVERAELVLHVGPGTFRPLAPEALASGRLHAERFSLPSETAAAIARTRARGGRVLAVGTTTLRALESAATSGRLCAGAAETNLFILPGFRFRVVERLLTNFHLPRSTLLMLVSAFGGIERIRAAYAHAVRRRYRFFSYGDAMLIERQE